MAKIVDPEALPQRKFPIPGAKPPVFSFPHQDFGTAEEVDNFLQVIRELRRQSDHPRAVE